MAITGDAAPATSPTRRRCRRAPAALLVIILMPPPPAAGAGAEALLEAVASAPPAAGTAIAIVAGDSGERTALLLPAVADALAGRGFTVDPRAELRLQVAATVVRLAGDGGRFRLHGSVGSASRPDVTLELPLPEWPGPRQGRDDYRYGITMLLGTPGRPSLWQGTAAAWRPTADDLAAEQRMAAALAARLGERVRAEPVAID